MNVWRAVKEKTRQAGYFFTGKSDTEKLVYEATNDDPWGPANNQMAEIARLSMNWNELENIKKALWERMGDTDEVRHVQKSLLLLEYLLRNGSESIRNDSRMMLGQLQSLTSLQQHETGEEAALEAVIRKKSADVIQMINDNDIYQMEREKAKKLNGAVTAVSGGGLGRFDNSYGGSSYGGNSYGSSSYGNSSYGGGGFNDSYSSTTKKPEPEPEEEDEELEFDPRQGAAAAAPAPAPAANTFDPFGAPAAPAPAPAANTFDPFGAPAPAARPAPAANTFDPFAAPAQPARPAQPAGGFNAFGAPAPAPAANTFNAFGAPAQPANTFNAFGAPAPAPARPQPQPDLLFGAPAAQPQRPAQPAPAAGGFDFLDLTAQPAQQQRPQQQGFIQQQQMNASMGFGQPMGQPQHQARPQKPVDNFGGLVDLDLKGGAHKGYGKAQQPRGNGPTLGGF